MCILGAREMNEILDRFYLGTEHFIETRLITQHEPSYRASATIFAHHHRTKLESAALLHIIHVSKCIEDTPLRTFQTPTLSNFLNQRGADAVANPRKSFACTIPASHESFPLNELYTYCCKSSKRFL